MDTGALSPGTVVNDGTGNEWRNVNNVKISDNVYAYKLDDWGDENKLKATNFGFSIPTGATIDGIEVEIERRATGDQLVKDDSLYIVKSDGNYGSSNKADTVNLWPTTDTYKTYGSPSDLWGETWTAEDINSSNFGVGISAHCYFVDYGSKAEIDHIRITVYYSVGTVSPFPSFFRTP